MNNFNDCIKKLAELYKESEKIHKINFKDSFEDITTNFLEITNKYIKNTEDINKLKIIIKDQETVIQYFLIQQINSIEYNIKQNYHNIFVLYREKISNRHYGNGYLVFFIMFIIIITYLLFVVYIY